MNENGGLNSKMFKAIVDILDLCHGVRNQDWDAVKARRSELELKASPQTREEEVYRVWTVAGERQ